MINQKSQITQIIQKPNPKYEKIISEMLINSSSYLNQLV
jgi:hypothetical protein